MRVNTAHVGARGQSCLTIVILVCPVDISKKIECHTYHIKNYILHRDLLRRILVLMKSQHMFLVLCKSDNQLL